jgi:DNA-binding transcriptional LysR family regulator
MKSYRYEDMRKILIAKTIAESGSMQKAARELKVTPSAISQSLAALEKKVGSPLFLRDQGNAVPTEACLRLLKKAQPALAALDSLFENDEHPLRIDYLDLGTYESLAHSVLTDFVHTLRKSHPDVRFNMVVSRTAELLKKLRTGELCTAIIVEADGTDRLRLDEVGRDTLGLYVSNKFSDRLDQWSSIEGLGFGVISTGQDGVPSYLRRFLKQLGTKPKVAMTSDSYEVLRRAAMHGLVAAVLPRRVALRNSGELLEVTRFSGREKSDEGEHKIFLASMDRCDAVEADFLARIARDCFEREKLIQLDINRQQALG